MKKALMLIATVAMLFSCRKIDQQRISGLSPGEVNEQSGTKTQFKEGEVMVRFKGSPTSKVGKISRTLKSRVATKPTYIMNVGDVMQAVEELKKDPNVEAVSPNYRRETIQMPTDSLYVRGDMWGLSKINANLAWQSGNIGDTNVYIGVIDEGIQYWHEDLCGQIWNNPFDPVDGADNDGNGYIDDIHGWCAFHGHNQICDGNDGHGTHVSGTIGAKSNGIGVVGVSPKVRIISGKMLEGWGFDEWGVQLIDYMVDLKLRHGLNIVAINCSWGGGGYNQFLKEAIDRAGAANILVVAAAGNSSTNNDDPGPESQPNYPSSFDCPNIISVGAIDWNSDMAYFSSYGATTVDIFAPGTGILSTIPEYGYQTGTYVGLGGTSMATPHVTGACALYAALNPTATAAQIKAAILNNAVPATSLQGKCVTGGYLNVASFTGVSAGSSQPNTSICTPPLIDNNPPTTPTLSVTGTGVGSVSLSWTPSVDNETSVKDYWVYVYPTSQPENTNDAWIVSGDRTSLTVFGYEPISYNFFIVARDGWNNQSNHSNTVTATPLADVTPPTPPVITTANAIDSTGIFYIFQTSTDDQAVSSYKTYYRIVGFPSWSTQNQSTYQSYGNILNLIPGNTYEVYMTATDIVNNESAPSNIVTVSLGGTQPPPPPGDTEAPSIPTGLAVTGSTTSSLSIAWNASSDNVGVTGYNVFWRQQGGTYQSFTSLNRVANFTGLPEGTTYEFYVNAFDAAGNTSGNSTVVSGTTGVTPPPPPPVSISVTLVGSSNGQIHNLNWTVTSNTSNPLTYELEVKEQGVFNLLADVSGTSSYSYIPGTNKKLTYRLKVTEASSGTVVYSNEVQVQSKNINRGD